MNSNVSVELQTTALCCLILSQGSNTVDHVIKTDCVCGAEIAKVVCHLINMCSSTHGSSLDNVTRRTLSSLPAASIRNNSKQCFLKPKLV